MSEEQRFRRSANIRAFETGDRIVLVAASGKVVELSGDSASLVRAVLEAFGDGATLREVRAAIELRADEALADPAIVDRTHALLVEYGALEPARALELGVGASVVLGVCGAIAASDTPRLARALLSRGHEVRIALTRTAQRFVRPDVLERITHDAVLRGMFAGKRVPHVELAEWGDVMLIAPASATTIGRIAAGDASDLVAAIALATAAPVLVAPAMHPQMLAAPATQRNLARLREDGRLVAYAGPAVETAHAPSARETRSVGAPSAESLVALLEAVLRTDPRVATLSPRAWDRLHRARDVREELEPALASALEATVTAGATTLDIGCGTGVAARAAASLGAHVIAIDVSEQALHRARSEHSDVVWLRDDITRSALHGTFRLVIDRACLHALPRRARPAYAASLRRLTASGAVALILARTGGPSLRGVVPVTTEEVTSLFGSDFLVEERAATAESSLFVLRRR